MNERPSLSRTAPISFVLNGIARSVTSAPGERLSDVVRRGLGLTGTKVGCNAGDCGACTVLMDGAQVCACMVAAAQADGRTIVSIEGLAASPHGPRAAGRLSSARRGPVRHLYAGHADGCRGPAGPPCLAGPANGHGRSGRRALPLHGLPENRRCRSRSCADQFEGRDRAGAGIRDPAPRSGTACSGSTALPSSRARPSSATTARPRMPFG